MHPQIKNASICLLIFIILFAAAAPAFANETPGSAAATPSAETSKRYIVKYKNSDSLNLQSRNSLQRDSVTQDRRRFSNEY